VKANVSSIITKWLPYQILESKSLDMYIWTYKISFVILNSQTNVKYFF